ncbi:hypothetical protein EYF80_054278 [Liparis tanakae]|uniref:Uncharacterized protein n=1 Tax=Liparis tanakae TaxID=230148 RepID=A0A4Z2F4D6_9TELE|nr:hypothetical protein EYF80_054278 [Liparis tanakae]
MDCLWSSVTSSCGQMRSQVSSGRKSGALQEVPVTLTSSTIVHRLNGLFSRPLFLFPLQAADWFTRHLEATMSNDTY